MRLTTYHKNNGARVGQLIIRLLALAPSIGNHKAQIHSMR